MIRRRVNRDTKHILYSDMPREFKSVLEDGPIEGEPLVSVCVITYNHGKYIRQCLDGILMQKVNFPYEILIHDDASPDDTADIIHEYWEKYPTVIKPILQTENQYSKGVDVSRFNFDRAKAKYIAQCEGDDYWTDDGKMQMQVDFLEEHGEYVECGHNIHILKEGVFLQSTEYDTHERYYSFSDLERGNLWRVDTASAIYRNIFCDLDKDTLNHYYACKANGDLKISLLLSQHGDCYIFPEQMSVYRYIVSHGTSWNARARGKNMAKFWYDSYTSAMDFVKLTSGKEIDLSPLLREALLLSIINWFRYMHKNWKENTIILWNIIPDYYHRYGLCRFCVDLFINIPLYCMKRIYCKISGRRVRDSIL